MVWLTSGGFLVETNGLKWELFSQKVMDALERLHGDLRPETHVAFVMWTPGSTESEAVISSGPDQQLLEAVQRRVAKG